MDNFDSDKLSLITNSAGPQQLRYNNEIIKLTIETPSKNITIHNGKLNIAFDDDRVHNVLSQIDLYLRTFQRKGKRYEYILKYGLQNKLYGHLRYLINNGNKSLVTVFYKK